MSDYLARAKSRYYRSSSRLLFRRPFVINGGVPYISFTFDDFPRSALATGGDILKRFGLRGTYYASFGLMGKETPTGSMFVAKDLNALLEHGHELGCHTFDHCHSAETETGAFERSIVENRRAFRELLPEASLRTFSYPISPPRVRTKRKVARHFVCCRGGGQMFNAGVADLNYLSAYFLEKDRDDPKSVHALIDDNRRAGGWLIFATHDISETPTPFGCTPGFFAAVVQHAVRSGARILPVVQAWEALGGV